MIHYTTKHAGEPVLFLHGFLEQGAMFEELTNPLKDFHCIVPDLPGHGKSTDRKEFSMSAMAHAVFELLDHLNIKQAHVVGHSMGAYVAMEMIRRAPERIKSVLFFQSTAGADSPELKDRRDRSIDAVNQNKTRYLRTVINGLFAEETKAQFQPKIDALIEDVLAMEEAAIIGATTGMRNRLDSRELVRDLAIPVGYFLGANDPVLPPERMLEEMKFVGPNNYFMDPKMGHMAHVEAPELANDYLRLWLKSSAQL
ncbi:MAG: alpha/beta hydrolase [Flavobacteriales bacterium]|nr:alpha/beta hydrolase [Flavobacteriales bacterium]MDG1781610.1 alpha/beta hydrolase [Flavobacteriales bacterium]